MRERPGRSAPHEKSVKGEGKLVRLAVDEEPYRLARAPARLPDDSLFARANGEGKGEEIGEVFLHVSTREGGKMAQVPDAS